MLCSYGLLITLSFLGLTGYAVTVIVVVQSLYLIRTKASCPYLLVKFSLFLWIHWFHWCLCWFKYSQDWLLDLNMSTNIGEIGLENFIKEYFHEKWNHMHSPKYRDIEIRLILKYLWLKCIRYLKIIYTTCNKWITWQNNMYQNEFPIKPQLEYP